MRSQLHWSFPVFLLMMAGLFGIHYLFMRQEGFSASSYLIGSLFLLPAAAILGYIFLTQLLEQRQRQEEELEELIREVLHEINLPIATIDANVAMVLKEAKEPKLRKRLERIGSATGRLEQLYRELAYALRRQIASVERERFDLAELLRERAETFRDFGRNPLKLTLEPLELLADRIGLEQVVDNLLENAMKYSAPDHPVELTLRGNELQICDHGAGMDENELLRIFERYYQGDRHSRGEGIGLALVKRYCDDEEIALRIRSRPGKGTTVFLDFSRRAG